jgi:hypothetical protein
MENSRSQTVYALGKVEMGSIFILTKFDKNHRTLTEYIPVFRTLSEAEMELTLMGEKKLNVLSFESVEALQKKSPACPVRYEFDLLTSDIRGGTA